MKKDHASLDQLIQKDLHALGALTAHALPPSSQVRQALTTAGRRPASSKGRIMDTVHRMRRHPRMLTGLCTAAISAAVLMMPISYQHTIGHSVRLTLSGSGLPTDPAHVGPLARRLRRGLSAEGVQIAAAPGSLTLTVRVPSRSHSEVQRRVDALVKGLAQEHIAATAEIAPRTEQLSGRVFAMALDKVIQVRVDMEGKSSSQIEAEIGAQLREQGVADAQVHVQRSGASSRIEISGEVGDRQMQIVRQTKGGEQHIQVDIGDIDTQRAPGMTDDQLRDKIERQLRARGLMPTVTVHGDEIRIQAQKPVEGADSRSGKAPRHSAAAVPQP